MNVYSFILYTTGNSPNSVSAIANLESLCSQLWADHHRIEIVDLLKHPERGLADRIFITPTLLKITPEPKQKVVGNLSDLSEVSHVLQWGNSTKIKMP
jgi:circadian clock protein KaiB